MDTFIKFLQIGSIIILSITGIIALASSYNTPKNSKDTNFKDNNPCYTVLGEFYLKSQLNISITCFILIFIISQFVNNNTIDLNLDKRSEKLTSSDIAGTWKGKSEGDGITLAETIVINSDGTFIERGAGGITGTGSSSLDEIRGSIYFIVEESKPSNDDYGNVVSTDKKYTHGIVFKFQTPYGLRESKYVFIDASTLVPVNTLFMSDVVLKKE